MATTTVAGFDSSEDRPLAQKVLYLDISSDDLDAGATTDTVVATAQLPAGCILEHVWCDVKELFADAPSTAAATLVVDLGDGTDADRFLNAVNISATGNGTPGTLGVNLADPANPDGATAGTDVYPQALSSAVSLTATFTSTSVNVDTMITGRIVIGCAYRTVTQGPKA